MASQNTVRLSASTSVFAAFLTSVLATSPDGGPRLAAEKVNAAVAPAAAVQSVETPRSVVVTSPETRTTTVEKAVPDVSFTNTAVLP